MNAQESDCCDPHCFHPHDLCNHCVHYCSICGLRYCCKCKESSYPNQYAPTNPYPGEWYWPMVPFKCVTAIGDCAVTENTACVNSG